MTLEYYGSSGYDKYELLKHIRILQEKSVHIVKVKNNCLQKQEEKENDEIKWTKDKFKKFCKIMGSYGLNGLTDELESLFPEAFEPQERKLELTNKCFGQIWEIKDHVCTVLAAGARYDLITIYDWRWFSIGSETCRDAKFLAPSLQEYLDKGGRIY